MFDLSAPDLAGGVLDCGGGPSSFTAESSACGFRAVSVDPIYAFSGSEIRARFEVIVDSMLSQVRATPGDWTWSYHRSPDDLLATRRTALEKISGGLREWFARGPVSCGELPSLPFAPASFGLALCSHLLFLYSDLLTEDFHIRAARELCRVAREARIFPLLTQSRQPSPHLAAVRSALDADGCNTEVVRVSYEFQRGGNQMFKAFLNMTGRLYKSSSEL